MSLPGVVETSLPSVPGFDSDTVISAALARQFYKCGYKFCLRYLSIGKESAGDLTTEEATDILNSGLALMPVQHVRSPGWLPSENVGQQDGQNALANAQRVGFPTGVNLWCDLEGVGKGVSAQDVIAYCQAWYSAVSGAGYLPGLYVGYAAQLSGDELYGLSFQHYWKSQSTVPDIPGRGYQMIQFLPPVTANGIGIDMDITQSDKKGGQAQWLRVS